MKAYYHDNNRDKISFVSFGAVAEYAHVSLKDIKLIKLSLGKPKDVRYKVVVGGESIGYIGIDQDTVNLKDLLSITKNYYKF